jgi:hypothetical protein
MPINAETLLMTSPTSGAYNIGVDVHRSRSRMVGDSVGTCGVSLEEMASRARSITKSCRTSRLRCWIRYNDSGSTCPNRGGVS